MATALVGLNASGRAPAAWSPRALCGARAMPQRGWETVTIPGAVSGWVALSQRYGKLPFGDLFEPAIRYARDGYAVSPVVAEKWALAAAVMPQGLGWQEHFLIDGRAPEPGERFRSRRDGDDAGERSPKPVARRFIAASSPMRCVAHAKALRRRARASPTSSGTRVDWVTPLAIDYRGVDRARDSAERPGHRRADGARHARNRSISRALPPDSVASQHLQIEAMKLAFADVHRYVCDPSTMTVAPQRCSTAVISRARAR